VLVRGAMFQLVRALARKDWTAVESMVSSLPDDDPWTAGRVAAELAPFFAEHAAIRTDPAARSPQNTRVSARGRDAWAVVQVICDEQDDNDWMLSCVVDLDASNRDGRPVIAMRTVSR
jgi:uncharacterized protein YdaU (DUF1376 family)